MQATQPTTLCGVQIYDLGPVAVTIEQCPEIVRGKPFMATLYRRKGLARYIDPDGTEHLADEATIYDCGADGVSRAYTQHKDTEPTEAERAEGRQRIREIVTQALVAQGIW